MGQKVHPKAFRLGVISSWDSKWFARGRRYAQMLRQDVEIRKFLRNKLRDASVAKVEIDRNPNILAITLHTGKPGVIIGRGGSGAEELRRVIEKKFLRTKGTKLNLSIKEVEHPLSSAQIVAQNIALEIERRLPFRRTMRRALEQVMKTSGVVGAKVALSGRLDGAEIARREILSRGKIPMHTLRTNIEFGRTVAVTTYGTVGVKVWINHGEVFNTDEIQKSKIKNQNDGVPHRGT
ncbi:MAG: 30S ribosomal protein S3 [Patescibacteria group bacterium]